jgi:putative acetyltransferase
VYPGDGRRPALGLGPLTVEPAWQRRGVGSALMHTVLGAAGALGEPSSKLFDRLPDETWFYPGHGKDSTLGAERPPSTSGKPAAGRATPKIVATFL